MQYSTLPAISTLMLAAAKLCSAVNMSQYDPQAGVQPEFKAFLTAYVLSPGSKHFCSSISCWLRREPCGTMTNMPQPRGRG